MICLDNKKIMLAAGVLIISICLAGVFFFKDFFIKQTAGDYRNITDLESAYNADAEIAQAMERLKNSSEKAAVITRGKGGQRSIALTFDGLADRAVVQQILDLLKKYNVQATFFVDGLQTAEDPQTVVNIAKEGHKIENYTLQGMAKMDKLPVERLVKDFSRAQKIIKVTTDRGPNLLKCNDTKYTAQLLQAAKACGFQSVVQSDAMLNVKQIKAAQTADGFVAGLKPGSIVSVKLKPNVDLITNEAGKTDLRPAIDKQPGLKELPPAELSEKDVVEAVEKLLMALKKANYATVYVEDFAKSSTAPPQTTRLITREALSSLVNAAAFLREQVTSLFTCRTAYAAEKAANETKEIKMIYTTEPALAFTFGGLSNEAVVDDVLRKLQELGIKGTFFVTETEMQKYAKTVRKIIQNGHEIGIAIRPKEGETFDETCKIITRGRITLHDQFGVATALVKQPWGAVSDTTKEAAAVLGCKLIGQTVNVVQTKHKDYTDADQVMSEIFGKSVFSLGRGQIVHFRMDFYTRGQLVVDLIEAVKRHKVDNIAYITSFDNPRNNPDNDSQYVIKPVGEILHNTKFTYHYPADPRNIPPYLRDDGFVKVDVHKFLSEASQRYIGQEGIDYEDRMVGFSKTDVRRLDKSGFVHTRDKVIFLTFDDWGTDASINKILYVLKKHNATATFFILTNNVQYNPNLLRAIAVQGHAIASHSDKHQAMSVRDPKTDKQVQTQEKAEYIKDYSTAFQKLRDVTGDVTVDGKPVLTRFFRPPTLALSRDGFEALFESGYEYLISGSSSTYDYKAENVTQLVRTMKDDIYDKKGELKKGSILIMHMADGSVFTAMALDILLTANEAKADADPSKFIVGRLPDYVKEGYVQMSRQHLGN